MFLILIILALVLLFVLFARRPVNTAGIHVGPPVPFTPATPPTSDANASETPVAAAPPADVQSVNFNDVFAPKAPPSDRPNA